MYSGLLNELIRLHSTLELKNQFKNSLIPYRKDEPVFLLGADCKVFSISNFNYQFDSQSCREVNTLLEGGTIEKIFNFKYHEICLSCTTKIYQGIACKSGGFCCHSCLTMREFGIVESKFPILSDYILSNNGFMIFQSLNYFYNNDRLLLSYQYHNFSVGLEIKYLKHIEDEWRGFRCLQNLITPIIQIDLLMSFASNCLCKAGCVLEGCSKLTQCTACPYIFLRRLSKLHAVKLEYISCFDLNNDLNQTIKDLCFKTIANY